MKRRLRIIRPYRYKKHFKVLGENILDKIKKILAFRKKIKEEKKVEEKDTFNVDRIAAYFLILLVFVVIPISYMFFILSNMPAVVSQGKYVDVVPLKAYLVDYGNWVDRKKAVVGFFDVNDSVNVKVFAGSYPISNRVYFVKGFVYEGALTNYVDFREILETKLSEMGFKVEEITVDFLDKIPDGSILIVANGYAPQGFWKKMEGRKFIIFYVGGDPNNEINEQGSILDSDFRRVYGKDVERVADVLPEGLTIYETPSFKISGAEFVRNFYSVIKDKDKPVLVALPLMLNSWNNGYDAALDFIKIFNDAKWIVYDNVVESDFNNTSLSIISPVLDKDDYVVYFFNASNKYYHPVHINSYYRGELYAEKGPVLLPLSLTKSPEKFSIKVEKSIGMDNERILLRVIDHDGIVDTKDLGSIAVRAEERFDYYNDKIGRSVVVFEAYSQDAGDVVARSVVVFGDFDIKGSIDKDKPIFYFEFLANGNPIRIGEAIVKFKGDRYVYRNVRKIAFNAEKYFGNVIPVGKHQFLIEIGGKDYNVVVEKPPQTGLLTIFSKPLNLLMLVLAVLIYSFGYFFVRKEDIFFSIDIPDFPPVEYRKIPVSSRQMISIIEEINEFYKWSFTPVSAEEIRKMFSTKGYKGEPVLVNTYNIEFIMNKLVSKGLVKAYRGYYGIAEWEKKSGFSIRQLVLYRILRDICVEYTIPFSRLGRSKGYHVKLKVGHLSYYGYIYDLKEVYYIFSNALKFVEKGIVFVLFGDKKDKEEFINYLYSNIPNSPEFRFAVNTGSIILLTIDEFKERIKEMV